MALSIGAYSPSPRGISQVATRLRNGLRDGTPGIFRPRGGASSLAGTTGSAISALRSGEISGIRSNQASVTGTRRVLDIRA